MSTQILQLIGKKEIVKSVEKQKIEYESLSVFFTSFWGGDERKKSLQITVNNEYVQLNNAQVKTLINSLIANFGKD